MPDFRTKTRRPFLEFGPAAASLTQHGGQAVIEALCRRFGIWKNIAEAVFPAPSSQHPALRVVAQMLFSFSSGGTTLAAAAALARDPMLLQLVGLEFAADEDTLRGWLDCQTAESVEALRRANLDFVGQAIGPAEPDGTGAAPPLEVVFREVLFESPHPPNSGNADGGPNSCRSWQTLSIGNFILDGMWSDVIPGGDQGGAHLPGLLAMHRKVWLNRGASFHPGNALESPEMRKAISAAGFKFWATEASFDTYYNCRISMPELKTGKPLLLGRNVVDQYGFLYPRPPLQNGTFPSKYTSEQICGRFIAARHNTEADPMKYNYLVVPVGHDDDPGILIQSYQGMSEKAEDVGSRLNALVRIENLSECHANASYFAIATLAFNLVTILRIYVLPELFRPWTNSDIIDYVLASPATRTFRARQPRFRLHLPSGLQSILQPLLEANMGPAKHGRPLAIDALRAGAPVAPKGQSRGRVAKGLV